MSKKPMDRLMDTVEWKSVPEPDRVLDDLPHVTHVGQLWVAGWELRVFQLSNGQRVIDPDDLANLFEQVPCE